MEVKDGIGKATQRVFILRNHGQWLRATPAEVVAELNNHGLVGAAGGKH